MIIALLLMVAFGLGAHAQVLKDGKYTAKIVVGEKYLNASFSVYSGYVYQDGVSAKVENTSHNSNTTTYTWLNNGGVWSENQTYVFTLDSKSGNIYVTMIRVVQNEGSDPWSYAGIGRVYKKS